MTAKKTSKSKVAKKEKMEPMVSESLLVGYNGLTDYTEITPKLTTGAINILDDFIGVFRLESKDVLTKMEKIDESNIMQIMDEEEITELPIWKLTIILEPVYVVKKSTLVLEKV